MPDWKNHLETQVARAQLPVIGVADVLNEAQAQVVLALLAAYGTSAAGAIYIEPCLSHSSHRPPDVVLCHQQIGVLVIEVKAFSIDFIQSVSGGNLRIYRNGVLKEENPLRQAQNAMFSISDAVKRRANDLNGSPLFTYLAAFPNITSGQWNEHGYDEAMPVKELLFTEQIQNPARLQQRLESVIQDGLRQSRKKEAMTRDQFQAVMAVFGDSAVLRQERTQRDDIPAETLGAYIDGLLTADKSLSREQTDLSRAEVETNPRLIRGVAGSGKTVVLANQVARLVNRSLYKPMTLFEAPRRLRVGVVCFNRTLVPFIQDRIETAYLQQTLEPLPQDAVMVRHINGLMYTLTQESDGLMKYLSTREEENAVARATHYAEQLEQLRANHPEIHDTLLFDVLFVDEGQDCEPEEYALLNELVRPHPQTGKKPLIIFYDDAQNIYGRQRPTWKQLGIDVVGRSHVMKQGFRNPREVVELGLNVLVGTHAPDDMRVQTCGFADLDTLKKETLIEDLGDHVRVKFAQRSHEFWKPRLHPFADREAEKVWLSEEIRCLIEQQHVRPEDILIVFQNRWKYQDLPERLLTALPMLEGVIQPHDYAAKDSLIFKPRHLTLSTTHSAKGYDAPIVFLLGADLFGLDNAGRAAFYVGVTRSRLRLYISGVVGEESNLLSEAQAVYPLL